MRADRVLSLERAHALVTEDEQERKTSTANAAPSDGAVAAAQLPEGGPLAHTTALLQASPPRRESVAQPLEPGHGASSAPLRTSQRLTGRTTQTGAALTGAPETTQARAQTKHAAQSAAGALESPARSAQGTSLRRARKVGTPRGAQAELPGPSDCGAAGTRGSTALERSGDEAISDWPEETVELAVLPEPARSLSSCSQLPPASAALGALPSGLALLPPSCQSGELAESTEHPNFAVSREVAAARGEVAVGSRPVLDVGQTDMVALADPEQDEQSIISQFLAMTAGDSAGRPCAHAACAPRGVTV